MKKVLIDALRVKEINTFDKALDYLKNQKLDTETIINKIKIEMLWNQLIVIKFSKNLKVTRNCKKRIIK